SQPKDKHQLRSFIGAANYLRSFIPSFADTIAPLTSLLSTKTAFKWSETENNAFNKVKEAVVNISFLSLPNPSKPFVIFCDASDIGVVADLAQTANNSTPFHDIQFASKGLNDCQKRWSVSVREVYAIVWACESFERYIKGIPTLVYTDHKNLSWLHSSTKGKLLRWALRLQEFDIDIRYIRGSE